MLGDLPTGGAEARAQASRSRKLPRTRPEAVGIPSSAILAFVEGVEQKVGGLHSFMLLRHGKVAAEGWWTPYAPAHPHMLYSLSKSFTSTALGFAVAEGKLTVDAPVVSFFSTELPAKVSDNLAAMRVRHLLSMSTGHDKDATGPTVNNPEGNWVKGFFSLPVEHTPGSKFVYNSAATYMCSAIVQKLTGMTVREYLTPRLFDPLGIEGPTWESCPKGINTGGWGLNVRTEDIARFGQLYLQKGKWNNKQILPEAWVEEATSKQVSNGDPANASDWSQGYGYQFWRCRNEAFRGDGAFGQYCVVMPKQDAVLAITSGVGDMQAVLNALWEHLQPAMQSSPISGNDADSGLRQRLGKLAIRPPEGKPTSETARRVSGKTFRFDSNPQKIQAATLSFEGNRATLKLQLEKGEHSVVCGKDSWVKGVAPLGGRLPLGDSSDNKVAARGAWAEEDTYTAKLCFYETPYIQTVTCKFADDRMMFETKMNVGFGPPQSTALVGRPT